MEVGNGIHVNKGEQWSFDNHVAEQFDEHVKLSVPMYNEGHEMICYLSDFFVSDHSTIYEIGSSTGALISKLYNRHSHKKKLKFIGVEPISKMIGVAKQHENAKHIEYVHRLIEYMNLIKCNLVVSYYCLQFVELSQREKVCQKIYDALLPGGALIIFEKEMSDDSKIEKLFTSTYIKFKMNSGFSSEEVIAKQLSLEGVMKTNTHDENKKMLKQAGFSHVASVMKYGEFNGYVCTK